MDVLVGFRFHPTEEEIIRFLEKKRLDPDFSVHAITETNIYDFEPGELFGLSQIQSDGKWCNFFCAPNYINDKSDRVHRATKTGYWKVTGKGSEINSKGGTDAIGRKRILVFYERGRDGKGTKTDWVMHEFSAEDNPLYKKDFVVCRVKRNGDKKRRNSTYVKGQPHKKLRTSTEVERQQHQNLFISIRDEGQVNHHLAFDNHSHTTKNIFPESQLPPNSNLISKFRNLVEEDTSIFESRNSGENTSISESRNHVEEYTSISEYEENTSPELQTEKYTSPELQTEENTSPEWSQLPTNDYLISKSRNHTSPELELWSQLPTNDYLISKSRNHVEENTSPKLQLLPQFLPSNYIEENTSKKLQILPQFLPNNNLISNARNHVEGNISPEKLLPSNYLISNSRNQVIENTSPKSLLQSSNKLISNFGNHIVENALPVYSDLPTIPNALSEGNELDEASFPTLQSLINQEKGSSYSSFSSSDYSQFGSEGENDFMNPQSVIHDPCEGTGRSILPVYVNSLEAGGGFRGGDSSDIDTETFNKWVKDIFLCNTPHVNHN